MTSTCEICDERMDKRTHVPINCLYCSYESCRLCSETYILDQSVAKCMNPTCAKEWPRKFLVEKFPKSFINGSWKQHREKVLFDRETALLPATQTIIEERKDREIRRNKATDEITRLDHTIQELQQNMNKLISARRTLNYQLIAIGNEKNDVSKKPRTFIRACSVEDCRGFLSTQWKCGLCDVYTCPDCHITKGLDRNGPHECKPDDLATAQLLAADTKCCPNCATGIFKIEGCDQMWCTQCHTAFSWRTGQIETRIHNPHYYEWMRQRGVTVPRQQGEIQCGRELDHRTTGEVLIQLRKNLGLSQRDKLEGVASDTFNEISNIIRSVIHLREVQLDSYRVDPVEDNVELRIKYLCKEIDKSEFQIAVQRKNKKHEKKQEIYGVLQLFITTITDIIYRVSAAFNNKVYTIDASNSRIVSIQHVIEIVRESDAIVEYVNGCLQEMSVTYNCKPQEITVKGNYHVLRHINAKYD